jgi:hypothetical protein
VILILFPADSLERFQPERDFRHEVAAAQAAGFKTAIFDFDAFTRDEPLTLVLRRIPEAEIPRTAVYRGWMLSPEQYERLYEGLQAKNWHLLNTPAQYRRCHYLPEAYTCIEGQTPRTIWLPAEEVISEAGADFSSIHQRLEVFAGAPILLKDYVKSQKHHWDMACFIPSAADKAAVERVTNGFLELQGSHLNGGLVYREFVTLRPLGHHFKSGMPLTLEWRVFWLDGAPFTNLRILGRGPVQRIRPLVGPVFPGGSVPGFAFPDYGYRPVAKRLLGRH